MPALRRGHVPASTALPHAGWHARREDVLPGAGHRPADDGDDQPDGRTWSSSGPG